MSILYLRPEVAVLTPQACLTGSCSVAVNSWGISHSSSIFPLEVLPPPLGLPCVCKGSDSLDLCQPFLFSVNSGVTRISDPLFGSLSQCQADVDFLISESYRGLLHVLPMPYIPLTYFSCIQRYNFVPPPIILLRTIPWTLAPLSGGFLFFFLQRREVPPSDASKVCLPYVTCWVIFLLGRHRGLTIVSLFWIYGTHFNSSPGLRSQQL